MMYEVKPLWTEKNMAQYLWYLQMSLTPISILVHYERPILKYDFLLSVNIPEVSVKQRSVCESTALNFDYLKTQLITTAMIL